MWQQAGEPFNGVYSGWVNVGAPDAGLNIDAPAVTSWREGRLDIVVRGNDDRCWHRVYDLNAGGWSGWEAFDGAIDSGPAISSNISSRIDIFARDATSGNLVHWCPSTMPAGQWESWNLPFLLQPAAASWGVGRRDVLVSDSRGLGDVNWAWEIDN
jgi:hypothetical protein